MSNKPNTGIEKISSWSRNKNVSARCPDDLNEIFK
jgi:hypothetical protein